MAYGPEAIVIVLAAADPQRRIVVLVPEVEPASPSQDILYDHRGLVLDRAIRKGRVKVSRPNERFSSATGRTSSSRDHALLDHRHVPIHQHAAVEGGDGAVRSSGSLVPPAPLANR